MPDGVKLWEIDRVSKAIVPSAQGLRSENEMKFENIKH
jgi:hypothetical protein